MNKLIVHGIIERDGKYLILERVAIKRNQPNMYPHYWDVPGGSVESGELPQDALKREFLEETGLEVVVKNIIWEDSNLDVEKNTVFTRLVYICQLVDKTKIEVNIDLGEHSNFKWCSKEELLSGQYQLVPYLETIMQR